MISRLISRACFIIPLALIFLSGCSTPGSLFKKRSPHQIYAQRLKDANLHHTAMGRAWLARADSVLKNPLSIEIPYQETGYFAADRVQAAAFRFEAKEGEKLTITLQKKPVEGFTIYLDLLAGNAGSEPDILASADSTGVPVTYEIDETGFYLLRLQPELLRGGEYTLSILSGPSLAYPIKANGNNHIQSFWGDGRDAGSRSHEGIDLFAPRLTPVIAAADGVVTRVNESNLGGKVVWLRPEGKDYRLYYAHLDSQLVTDGEQVKTGDILGLMGNTGNARTTAPHLHFGIYTFGGAVDPLPFVSREIRKPAKITAQTGNLNATVRTNRRDAPLYDSPGTKTILQRLPLQTTLLVEAASSDLYKATLPDGRRGYIPSTMVSKLSESSRKLNLRTVQPLLDEPDTGAARKTLLASGSTVNILGTFENYCLVTAGDGVTGWIQKTL